MFEIKPQYQQRLKISKVSGRNNSVLNHQQRQNKSPFTSWSWPGLGSATLSKLYYPRGIHADS